MQLSPLNSAIALARVYDYWAGDDKKNDNDDDDNDQNGQELAPLPLVRSDGYRPSVSVRLKVDWMSLKCSIREHQLHCGDNFCECRDVAVAQLGCPCHWSLDHPSGQESVGLPTSPPAYHHEADLILAMTPPVSPFVSP
jgi:hypothetical protein